MVSGHSAMSLLRSARQQARVSVLAIAHSLSQAVAPLSQALTEQVVVSIQQLLDLAHVSLLLVALPLSQVLSASIKFL